MKSMRLRQEKVVLAVAVIVALFWLAPIAALPPFVPLSERARESDLVVVGDLSAVVSMRSLDASAAVVGSYRAEVEVRVIEVFKGELLERIIYLSLFVDPDGVESEFLAPPAPGRYLIFLMRSGSGDYELYRPAVFALDQIAPGSDLSELRAKLQLQGG